MEAEYRGYCGMGTRIPVKGEEARETHSDRDKNKTYMRRGRRREK